MAGLETSTNAAARLLAPVLAPAALDRLADSVLETTAASVSRWRLEPVAYDFGSPTTDGLWRLHGVAEVGATTLAWSVFVKVIHSYRHWPVLASLPPPAQEQALGMTSWRYESEAYGSAELAAALPDGLRLPRVHRVADLGDERIALLLEDVAVDPTPWGADRFASAARSLGRFAARVTRADALPAGASRVPGELGRLMVASRLDLAVLPALNDDAVWTHPLLSGPRTARLRTDMLELADRLPRLLDARDRLPQTCVHGDASPQNLLVPAAEPHTFVAVDWTLGGIEPVGDDLGQLLVGLAHAGELAVDALSPLHAAVVDGFTLGLADDAWPDAGPAVTDEAVAYGMDTGLAVRSALTSLPLERLLGPATDELAVLVAQRLELTRWLVDLGLALPLDPGRS